MDVPAADARDHAFARLCDHARVGAFVGILSDLGDRTLAVNPQLRLIFGYPLETDEGAVAPFGLDRFIDPLARPNLVDRLRRDGSITDFLVRVRRADLTPIWVEITGWAEAAADGGVRLEALVRDVSDRKKLDDQTRDLYHQLLQAEKLASLGQTISGIAHELNNPLATILTWAERLSRRQVDDQTRRGLDVILSEAERSARIVRNLLTFARKRHTTRAMVDVNQVVEETLTLRAYEQRVTNITVIDALAAGLPHIFVDQHQIQQVLLNLIINAEQAILSVRNSGNITVSAERDGDQVRVAVSDDGPGIPADKLKKIFDPFFTTKPVGQGTGLGLSISFGIVQEHGGRIYAESEEGRGARLVVELPIAASPPKTAGHEDTPHTEIKDRKQLLIVDDEESVRELLLAVLEDEPFDIETACTGEEALVKACERDYDLIITDLKMPGLNGAQFCDKLRQKRPFDAPRFLFMTGDVLSPETQRFLDSTRSLCMLKPFDIAQAKGTVLRALAATDTQPAAGA